MGGLAAWLEESRFSREGVTRGAAWRGPSGGVCFQLNYRSSRVLSTTVEFALLCVTAINLRKDLAWRDKSPGIEGLVLELHLLL